MFIAYRVSLVITPFYAQDIHTYILHITNMKIPLLRWYIFPSAFLIIGYILYVIVV